MDSEKRANLNVAEKQETSVLTEPGDQEIKARLELLCRVGQKVGTAVEVSELLDQIMHMNQQVLQTAASSVLLVDGEKGELYFQIAQGKVGKALKQIRLSVESGIAGWVARYGKPLLINDVSADRRFNNNVDKVTGFVTRSVLAVPLISRQRVIGVLEVLNKVDGSEFSAHDLETLVSLASTAAAAIENARLHEAVLDGYKSTIKALAAAIDAKDPYTCGHSQRVMEYSLLGGMTLSLPKEWLDTLEYAGILHDIGKIGVSDNILRKSGYLNEPEWIIIRKHPEMGANIIKGIPFLEEARKLILHHHERYDGNGYPDGLKGEAIPMGARLLAIADAFDTMTTDRSYRAALSADEAISELRRHSGTQFCPVAVEASISGLVRMGCLLNNQRSSRTQSDSIPIQANYAFVR